MKTRARKQWIAGGALAALLVGVVALAGPATAEPEEKDTKGVDVNVNIEARGALTFSVESDSVTLAENGTTAEMRKFTGTLPTVTVTDTRNPLDIPDGTWWSVLGTASDFEGTAGQADITADHLGWTPNLISDPGEGVAEGQEVVTSMDAPTIVTPPNNVGLVDQELLVSSFDSGDTAPGVYKVNANLFLHTSPLVQAGTYTSTLTLSLFE